MTILLELIPETHFGPQRNQVIDLKPEKTEQFETQIASVIQFWDRH